MRKARELPKNPARLPKLKPARGIRHDELWAEANRRWKPGKRVTVHFE